MPEYELKINKKIRIKLNKKKLYATPRVKKEGVEIDENLNWHNHINDIATMVNRENTFLFKTRNCVSQKTLTSIYFIIFDSNLNYTNLIKSQNSNAIQQILILQ